MGARSVTNTLGNITNIQRHWKRSGSTKVCVICLDTPLCNSQGCGAPGSYIYDLCHALRKLAHAIYRENFQLIQEIARKGNIQEIAQSERKSHSKYRGGTKLNCQ